jgi:hypothetical protein
MKRCRSKTFPALILLTGRVRLGMPWFPTPGAEGKDMKRLLLTLSALSLIAGSAPALAAPCKDKKGKFIKCPAKPTVCRNAKGHFAKCK